MRGAGRLAVLLGLIGATAAFVALTPQGQDGEGGTKLSAMPVELAGWTSTWDAPEWALPRDPNEGTTVRRTYQRGDRVIWTSVALFTRQNAAGRRPSIDRIYPEKNTSRIDRLTLPVALNGVPGGSLRLPVIIGQKEQQRLVVVYWHQLGGSAYGTEYGYRLALMREVLFRRPAESALVRIAMSMRPTDAMDESLRVASEIAPPLYGAVASALAPDAGPIREPNAPPGGPRP